LSVGSFSVSGMTAVGWARPKHPVTDAVTAMHAALDETAGMSLWSLPDDEVDSLLADVHRLQGRVAGVAARLVAEVDRRELAKRAGGASTQAWLRHRLQLAPAEAKQQVTSAGALTSLDLIREALAVGDLSRAHAEVVVKMMDTLPSSLGQETMDRAERQLVAWCREFDPRDVARLGRRLWEVVDPDGADEREGELLAKQEREASRRRHLSIGGDGFGRHLLRGVFDPESAATISAALDPLAKPLSSTADGTDPRTPGQRYADALVELCRRQLAAGDLPTRGGERPQLMLTVSFDNLRAKVGSGLLDNGNRLSPDAVRKLACDATVLPAVLDGDGQPLDLGRACRTFTPAQRRALGLRDGNGCAFPGCDRPLAWCDGHHIRHWVDGGPTDLANGVLLCGYHHTVIHRGDWVIGMAADGRPKFRPPAWIDPVRKPLRNHFHRRE
jgi:Domain of unknown function (DUF222)